MPFKTVEDTRVYVYDSFARHVNVTNVSTTRHGGVSLSPYDSLNLGRGTNDDDAKVDANRARLSLLTSHDDSVLVTGVQVHAADVAVVTVADAGRRFEATDALVTDVPEVPLMILVADCAAVSFYDPIKKVVGIAHAGWRGTVAGVAVRTVGMMMDEFNTDPTDLIVGIGPSIGPCCYEVGADVVDRFYAEQPLVADHVLSSPDFASAGSFEGAVNEGRKMLNLWRANTLQLVTTGVFEANITSANICTACNTDDFFSHRAESGLTGRFGGLIMLHEKTKRSY
jgi:YfiH family protein